MLRLGETTPAAMLPGGLPSLVVLGPLLLAGAVKYTLVTESSGPVRYCDAPCKKA